MLGKEVPDDGFFSQVSSSAPSISSVPIQHITNNSTWFDACPSSHRGICLIQIISSDSGCYNNFRISLNK